MREYDDKVIFDEAQRFGRLTERIDPDLFYTAYLSSYVERDVIDLISATNLGTFQRFIKVCATYAGQLLNLSKLSRDTGVSVPTATSWLGVLEQSFVVFRLQPFYRNLGKRLIKSPKLYFYDTGLLSFLLGAYEPAAVERLPQYGALFENLVIADAIKRFHHKGYEPSFYFYRDDRKQEVDLVYEKANLARLWEIKSTEKIRPRLLSQLEKIANSWDRPTETFLIYDGDEERRHNKTYLVNWRSLDWER